MPEIIDHPNRTSRQEAVGMTIPAAILELRRRLGASQQAFATELGLAIRTVARYEKARKPEPKMIVRLYLAAVKHEQLELAEVFRHALNKELGVDVIVSDHKEGGGARSVPQPPPEAA